MQPRIRAKLMSRAPWAALLIGTIALGLLSRTLRLGWVWWDKYLGDALYAAMVYALIRLVWLAKPSRIAALAMTVMAAIEIFQLTRISAQLLASQHLLVRLGARLLGTEFNWLDLLAYAAGIGTTYFIHWQNASRRQ